MACWQRVWCGAVRAAAGALPRPAGAVRNRHWQHCALLHPSGLPSPRPRALTTTGCTLSNSDDEGDGDGDVTHAELVELLLTANPQGSLELFDVRRNDEYARGAVPSAVNIPVDELEAALQLPDEAFVSKYRARKPTRSTEHLVFYCRSGVRSARAVAVARSFGLTQARSYRGSYLDWQSNYEPAQ